MKYIFVLKSDIDTKYEINYKKDEIKYDKNVFEEYNNLIKEIKIQESIYKNIYYKEHKTRIFKEDQIGRNFLFNIYGMKSRNTLYINDTLALNKNNIELNIHSTKYENIVIRYGSKTYDVVKNITENERESILQKTIIVTLYNLYDLLKIGGNLMFSSHNFNDSITIDIIYLLLNFFEKIIFIGGLKIFCLNYRFTNITKNIIEDIFNNNCVFTITPKTELKSFIKYLENIFKLHNKVNKTLLYNSEEKFLTYRYKTLNELFLETGYINNEIKLDLQLLFINYFRIKFNNKKITPMKISSAIRYEEGNYIYKIIDKHNFTKCLEIGFANGISAIYTLMNKKTNLISIDPYQDTQWNNEGLKLIKKLKLNKKHKLIKKKSYEALPLLLTKYGEGYFDFIFIDGWHTFDYTLIDFFYSNLLLKIGGIIIIDDALHNGVSKCVKYIDTNYKFYKRIYSTNTIASYQKIDNDTREWNFHNFF